MNANQGTPSSAPAPRLFLVWLGVGFLILNLFVILMAMVSLRQSRKHYRERAIATAQNLSLVLDHYVTDTLSKADLAVLAVKDEVERTLADPKGKPRDLDAFIRRQHERVPELVALRTSNAQGVINHGSTNEADTLVSAADRAHFIRLRDVPDAGRVISKPLVGRLTGTWVIIVARRLERPDHSFAGMAVAVVGLEQFQKAFSDLDLGRHGSVALRDLDLGLIARFPEPTSAGTAVGQQVVSREFQAFAQSGRREGIFETRTPFDRVQRTFSARRIAGQPYYLLVGVAEQDYLAPWRLEVIQESMEVLLFASLTLVATGFMWRAWLRQRAAHENLGKLLAEVKTLGGMLPICSHCKKIRDDKGYWNQIEAYLNEHIEAEFTHGICPDCAKEIFPGASGKHSTM